MSSDAHPSIPPESASSSSLDARPSTVRVPRMLFWFCAAVLAWFLISEGATEAWYRWREAGIPTTARWEVNFPDASSAAARGFLSFQARDLSDREKELLQYDRAESAAWRDSDGNQWTSFHLEWAPDHRLNNSDISHNPTICLQAVGMELVDSLAPVTVEVGGHAVHFDAWKFRSGEQQFFVYMAVRRERDFENLEYSPEIAEKRTAKFGKVLEGNRGNPLQVLEFVVIGPKSETAARHSLESMLSKLISS